MRAGGSGGEVTATSAWSIEEVKILFGESKVLTAVAVAGMGPIVHGENWHCKAVSIGTPVPSLGVMVFSS